MLPPTPYRPRPAAFTLIELLTVIAIIGVLAAILIPVVGKVRSSARNAQCVSNLRQIGSAFQSFATDNRNLWPAWNETNFIANYPGVTAPRWHSSALAPYVGAQPANVQNSPWAQAVLDGTSIFRCPSADSSGFDLNSAWQLGYAYNLMIPPGSRTSFNTLERARPSTLSSPSRTVVVADSTNHRIDGDRMGSVIEAGNQRHSGKVNLLFADGHVNSLSVADADDFNTWSTNPATVLRWTGR